MKMNPSPNDLIMRIPDMARQGSSLQETVLVSMLDREATILRSLIQKHIEAYYASYQPTVYERQYRLLHSLVQTGVRKTIFNGRAYYYVYIEFDDSKVIRDSLFSSNTNKGHSAILISQGWKTRKPSFRDVPRFGYFRGYDFIGRAIDEYVKMPKSLPVKIIRYSTSKGYSGNDNYSMGVPYW